ncbi:MAG: hypothetical protein M2R45_02888 [Verrucomicrobia subdivision 3 bacterium]|nr:hypothetical protein [Limisphaerales bacterium]MCS1414740.1 hypothetical protein [Limisphaerales bacterium]
MLRQVEVRAKRMVQALILFEIRDLPLELVEACACSVRHAGRVFREDALVHPCAPNRRINSPWSC